VNTQKTKVYKDSRYLASILCLWFFILAVNSYFSSVSTSSPFHSALYLVSKHMKFHILSFVPLCVSLSVALNLPLAHRQVPLGSNFVNTNGIFEATVEETTATWMRVKFDLSKTRLRPSETLRLTSDFDGYTQEFENNDILAAWGGMSAFFNGNKVKIQVLSDGREEAPKVEIAGIVASANRSTLTQKESLCNSTDRRTPSRSRREGRLMPIGCTAFLVNDAASCFLTAAHCRQGAEQGVVQFHVPDSDADGKVRHPQPKHQYPVDPASIIASDKATPGDDWMYFGTLNNPETKLSAYAAQKSRHKLLKAAINASEVGDILIAGYGSAQNKTRSQTQLTHIASFEGIRNFRGGLPVITYLTDTTSGSSGAAILDTSSGKVIGIHTNGECSKFGGYNYGTPLSNPNLQKAMKNPRGVCKL
jgi:hypothetical protein